MLPRNDDVIHLESIVTRSKVEVGVQIVPDCHVQRIPFFSVGLGEPLQGFEQDGLVVGYHQGCAIRKINLVALFNGLRGRVCR